MIIVIRRKNIYLEKIKYRKHIAYNKNLSVTERDCGVVKSWIPVFAHKKKTYADHLVIDTHLRAIRGNVNYIKTMLILPKPGGKKFS